MSNDEPQAMPADLRLSDGLGAGAEAFVDRLDYARGYAAGKKFAFARAAKPPKDPRAKMSVRIPFSTSHADLLFPQDADADSLLMLKEMACATLDYWIEKKRAPNAKFT